ncbi:MAG TPA: hypothetical protein IAA58_11470 [Candidatus Gallacutalibacter stercoravium]|nr:hypothetical protein [Candidatus Gallacutalibacter stercoravium]
MVQNNRLALPLLDYLAYAMGCEYLSDLRQLNNAQRAYLARVVGQIPHDAAALCDWNDALDYLAGAPQEACAQNARLQLIARLSQLPPQA